MGINKFFPVVASRLQNKKVNFKPWILINIIYLYIDIFIVFGYFQLLQ